MFIVFEGIDGSGKSTLIEFFRETLQTRLQKLGRKEHVLKTREPGGSELAEQIRALIMHYDMHIHTEILLMYAARIDHFEKTILPAIEAGDFVLSDRFFYSSFAYQGAGRGGDVDLLDQLQAQMLTSFQEKYQPNLLVLLDLDVSLAQSRRKKRKLLQQNIVDRFEDFDSEFQKRVQTSYREQVKLLQAADVTNMNPEDFKNPSTKVVNIDATESLEAIQEKLSQLVDALISLKK